jgi:hypothetical protein
MEVERVLFSLIFNDAIAIAMMRGALGALLVSMNNRVADV